MYKKQRVSKLTSAQLQKTSNLNTKIKTTNKQLRYAYKCQARKACHNAMVFWVVAKALLAGL